MARRGCCPGQAVRGPRAVILPRRIGAVHVGGVVWGDHLQVDSHQCLQTFWNLAKCQMRVVSHYLYRAFHHVIAACNSLEKKLFAPLTDHSMPWKCCPQSEESRLLLGSISTSALSIFIAVLLLCASIPVGLVKS